MNSIYKNHVKTDLKFYYLYYRPMQVKFYDDLKDTLSNYLSDSEILYIKNQIGLPDTAFIWDYKCLLNSKVIQDDKLSEIQSKYQGGSNPMIDGRTGKPVENRINWDTVKCEEKQVYFFSKPIWSKYNKVVIICIDVLQGNEREYDRLIYYQDNNTWRLLTKMLGLVSVSE